MIILNILIELLSELRNASPKLISLSKINSSSVVKLYFIFIFSVHHQCSYKHYVLIPYLQNILLQLLFLLSLKLLLLFVLLFYFLLLTYHIHSLYDFHSNVYFLLTSSAHYDKWKEYIAGIDTMKTVTKNDKLKVLKAFLNFGEKRYGYNFHQVLLNMERFKNPDELVEEKVYYDINEFDKFLSAEDEDRYRILWETLYYCELRIGEARGLQWKDINLENKTL